MKHSAFQNVPHVVEEKKSSAWQCALQMYYKFSAGALGTILILCIKVMTSEFQHLLHLQDFTLVGKIYDHIESGGGFNRDMFECFSDGNH